MSRTVEILKLLAIGIFEGILYFIVYLVLLPLFFMTVLKTPLDVQRYLLYLWFFVVLGIATSILRKNPISIPLRILLKIIGIVILFKALNRGVIETSIYIDSTPTRISIDITIILYVVAFASIVHALIDIFNCFSSITETQY